MKLLSLSILLGSLLISFNYVWVNRISVTKSTYKTPSMVLLNKWTGNHCVFIVDRENREDTEYDRGDYNLTICKVDETGQVTLP